MSELVLCLDAVGAGHQSASGVFAISRQSRKAITSQRTVNGAWHVVNTCDQSESLLVCLVVYWMLLDIIFPVTFLSFLALLFNSEA